MNVDLRRPTIVIAGAFNAAIFTPEWIAAVLHEIPEGSDVEGLLVADTGRQSVRTYINGVGIALEGERLTFAWDSLDGPSNSVAEKLVRRVAETLPHTPSNGVGVNFHFETTDFDAEVVDKLKMNDDPAQIGIVMQSDLKSKIQLESCILNFGRTILNGNFMGEFNYHHEIKSIGEIEDIFNGSKVTELFERSKEILESLYDLDSDDIEYHKALAD